MKKQDDPVVSERSILNSPLFAFREPAVSASDGRRNLILREAPIILLLANETTALPSLHVHLFYYALLEWQFLLIDEWLNFIDWAPFVHRRIHNINEITNALNRNFQWLVSLGGVLLGACVLASFDDFLHTRHFVSTLRIQRVHSNRWELIFLFIRHLLSDLIHQLVFFLLNTVLFVLYLLCPSLTLIFPLSLCLKQLRKPLCVIKLHLNSKATGHLLYFYIQELNMVKNSLELARNHLNTALLIEQLICILALLLNYLNKQAQASNCIETHDVS